MVVSGLRFFRAAFSMRMSSDAGDEFGNRLDTLERRSKVDDACPQGKFPLDNRVGQERFSAGLDAGKNVAVQSIQVLFCFSGSHKPAMFGWHVAKRCDA